MFCVLLEKRAFPSYELALTLPDTVRILKILLNETIAI
jgi:hypothetical protein